MQFRREQAKSHTVYAFSRATLEFSPLTQTLEVCGIRARDWWTAAAPKGIVSLSLIDFKIPFSLAARTKTGRMLHSLFQIAFYCQDFKKSSSLWGRRDKGAAGGMSNYQPGKYAAVLSDPPFRFEWIELMH